MKISNMLDTQLPVAIVGPNGDKENVLLQPRGGVDLPEGFKVVNDKLKGLYVHPEAVTAAPVATPVATSGKKAATTDSETTK